MSRQGNFLERLIQKIPSEVIEFTTWLLMCFFFLGTWYAVNVLYLRLCLSVTKQYLN